MKKLLLIGVMLCMLFSCNSHKGQEWVDLGLPSGLKWATCNVGASDPEDYGHYYTWGETDHWAEFDPDKATEIYKAVEDGLDISGNPGYDAARAKWGGKWRMPTEREFDELIDKCDWTWTSQGGRKGYKVTGPNGNSIFLPAAGVPDGGERLRDGKVGRYWSCTPEVRTGYVAVNLNFDEEQPRLSKSMFDLRCCIRPVLED